ncbi:transcription initiation factor TFIID subunit 1 [Caerostris extrusa]|uniref:Transcription initiation factor TFIID subunit 1 n=1 Tax=Caerostris extrusa TaxID=172846 RepID=A0AAV4TKL0_CAEEX|nr:transcription initiation factor TFIID subunit 1 [Caerostris extrusa]
MEDEDVSSSGWVSKSPSAIDYYDFNELCEDEEENNTISEFSEQKDKIAESRILTVISDSVAANEKNVENSPKNTSGKPLAGVLPEKYKNVNVKSLVPHFEFEKVLRFLKVFGPGKPSSLPNNWRKKRKNPPIKVSEPLKELEVESDDEIKFLNYQEPKPNPSSSTNESLNKNKLDNGWRHGPAKLWYDMSEVPENALTYDYGFKLRDDSCEEQFECEDDVPAEAFLMVTQRQWENDVIWDSDLVKKDVCKKAFSNNIRSGWLPYTRDSNMLSFRQRCAISTKSDAQITNKSVKDVTFNMFPEENEKLNYYRWEEQVIWDSEAMSSICYPKALEPDPDIIIDVPEDEPPPRPDSPELIKDKKDKKFRPVVEKPVEEDENICTTNNKDNFYNISNDEYYNPKISQETVLKPSGMLLQHSIPATELRSQLFPTHLTEMELRSFHRPQLKDYPYARFALVKKPCAVYSLTRYIQQEKLKIQKEIKDSGGGTMFFMRKFDDLSGKDCTLVLFEFSEQFPPLMNQIGMASKIKNYYRRTPGIETSKPKYKYGEIVCAHTSPFLGNLRQGQSLQTYENNLFRAPIYEHSLRSTDFLVILYKKRYFIRLFDAVFCVGQELPLTEVPAPKSEKANNFAREFLNLHIYRLFRKSKCDPPRLKMEDLRKAFPLCKESSVRKRLSQCANFNRAGGDSKCWVLKSSFRLPPEEETRTLVTPEKCCAYYSMLAAEQRWKDIEFHAKFQNLTEQKEEVLRKKIDDENKTFPWNTTQAFISAMKGKCLLDLWGSADPTGCGEGFSFVKLPIKPQFSKDDSFSQNSIKRLVKGTDADLRRLSLKNAYKLLKNFNMRDEDLKNMSRWQIINLVRVKSTQLAKMGEEGNTKFARGNLHSQAEHFRKYKEDCQRIFEIQNEVLSSAEVLSSDEESSDESDMEECGKRLESMILNKKSAAELQYESEEAGRKELKKILYSEAPRAASPKNEKVKQNEVKYADKLLKIYRTYRNDGREYVRAVIVRNPETIQRYIEIRDKKDDNYIRENYLTEKTKEDIRKEKRRLQDQLRRIKRNELKMNNKVPPKMKKMESSQSLKVTCGACGAAGHMRTNKACPLYASSPSVPSLPGSMNDEPREVEETIVQEDQNMVYMDGQKLFISKHLFKKEDEIRRKSLVIKIPKQALSGSNKKKRGRDERDAADYLNTPKAVRRMRVDPIVKLSSKFGEVIKKLKSMEESQPFWFPVDSKSAPTYHTIIKNPMDLETMKTKINNGEYKNREMFVGDMELIVNNSSSFNGKDSWLTRYANKMMDYFFRLLEEMDSEVIALEKLINPLLDSPLVALNFILKTIVNENLKTVRDSWPFHKPVDKRVAKGYYTIVKKPMDLDTISKKCESNEYRSEKAFLSDVTLILTNSNLFNGDSNNYTETAKEIVKMCHVALEMYGPQIENFKLEIKSGGQNDESEFEEEEDESEVKNNGLEPESPSRKIRFVVKDSDSCLSQNATNCNGDLDTDMFVDVESMDMSLKNSSAKIYNVDYNSSEKIVNSSNSPCLFSSPLNLENNLESENHFTSSPPPTNNVHDFLPVNGIAASENVDGGNNFKPYSLINCDTICDDLMLSSDSDEEMQTVES